MMNKFPAVAAAVLMAVQSFPAAALEVERLPAGFRGSPVVRIRSAAGTPQDAGVEVVSGEALVRFSEAMDRQAREAALSAAGGAFVRELPGVGWTLVSLPPGVGVASGLSLLEAVPGVLEAAPNHAYRASRVPDDTLFWTQYHLDKINAPAGWTTETGAANPVTVAVVDTGIASTHPDLGPKLLGYDQFCDPGASKAIGGDNSTCVTDTPASPACNHGTRVSGIAGGVTDNRLGIAGVGWAVNLVSFKIFRDEDCDPGCTSNACSTDDTAIVDALDRMRTWLDLQAGVGRIVANLSIGGPGGCPAAVQTAVNNAVADNIVVVVSAGNDGGGVNSPANCANVIPVGATDENNAIASFSSNGAEMTNNGVSAPGVNIVTTDLSLGYTGAATGTSFSAPIVAGAAALYLSMAAHNAATPAQVQDALQNTAFDLGGASSDTLYGAGLVDVCRLLDRTDCGTSSGLAGFAAPDSALDIFPNPLRLTSDGGATIRVPAGMQGGSPTIKIYTMAGQLVRTLEAYGDRGAWDGKNEAGNTVASGVYLVLLQTAAGKKKGRVAVIN